MANDALANLTDDQVKASARRMSRAARWLFFITLVFFTLGVWVDLRWFAMTVLSTVLMTVALITAEAGGKELRERNPDFKWEEK